MFTLLWQINTNLSWSTHFLLNGNLLIWYLCFLFKVRESWTCIKDTFSANFLCLEIGLYAIIGWFYWGIMFNVTRLIIWNERYHSICSVSKNRSKSAINKHFVSVLLVLTHRHTFFSIFVWLTNECVKYVFRVSNHC